MLEGDRDILPRSPGRGGRRPGPPTAATLRPVPGAAVGGRAVRARCRRCADAPHGRLGAASHGAWTHRGAAAHIGPWGHADCDLRPVVWVAARRDNRWACGSPGPGAHPPGGPSRLRAWLTPSRAAARRHYLRRGAAHLREASHRRAVHALCAPAAPGGDSRRRRPHPGDRVAAGGSRIARGRRPRSPTEDPAHPGDPVPRRRHVHGGHRPRFRFGLRRLDDRRVPRRCDAAAADRPGVRARRARDRRQRPLPARPRHARERLRHVRDQPGEAQPVRVPRLRPRSREVCGALPDVPGERARGRPPDRDRLPHAGRQVLGRVPDAAGDEHLLRERPGLGGQDRPHREPDQRVRHLASRAWDPPPGGRRSGRPEGARSGPDRRSVARAPRVDLPADDRVRGPLDAAGSRRKRAGATPCAAGLGGGPRSGDPGASDLAPRDGPAGPRPVAPRRPRPRRGRRPPSEDGRPADPLRRRADRSAGRRRHRDLDRGRRPTDRHPAREWQACRGDGGPDRRADDPRDVAPAAGPGALGRADIDAPPGPAAPPGEEHRGRDARERPARPARARPSPCRRSSHRRSVDDRAVCSGRGAALSGTDRTSAGRGRGRRPPHERRPGPGTQDGARRSPAGPDRDRGERGRRPGRSAA